MDPVTEEPEHETLAAAMDPYMGETRPERERRRSTSLPPRALKPNYSGTTSTPGPVIVTKDPTKDNDQSFGGLVHPAHRPQMSPRQHSSGSGRFYAAVPIPADDRRSPEHNHPSNYPQTHNRGLLHPDHNTHPSNSVSPISSTSTNTDLGTPTSPAELETLPSSPTSSAPVIAAAAIPHTAPSNTGVKRTPSHNGRPDVPVPRRSSKRSRDRRALKLLNEDEARGFQFGFDSSDEDERERFYDSEQRQGHGHGHGHARHVSDSDVEDEKDALISPGPWRDPGATTTHRDTESPRRGAKSRGRGDYEQVHGFDDVDLNPASDGRGSGDIGDERGRPQSITRKPVGGHRAGNVVGTAPAG